MAQGHVKGKSGRGYAQYKMPYEDVPQKWVAESATWYINDTLIKCKTWYLNGSIFFFNLNLSQIWFKFRKWWKNQVILVKIWPKIGQIELIYRLMGHSFMQNVFMYGSTFKFPVAHPYLNQLEYPPHLALTSKENKNVETRILTSHNAHMNFRQI